METILVIGAGFMGAGIAQSCLMSGYKVILNDVDDKVLEKAERSIAWSLDRLFKKGRIAEPAGSVLERLETAREMEPNNRISWVIEAVYEDEALKKELLTKVEKIVGPDTRMATNTSSIPVKRLASCLEHPARFVGLHFFGPVPLMGLVEVIKGEHTDESVFKAGIDFVKSLGKHPVGVSQDIPGFVMNRVFGAAFRECMELVARGVTTPADIDAGMRLGYGWNIGPFEIADNAGIDTFLRVQQSMKALGETFLYSDTDLIEEMVEEEKLGRKSGQGFYRYDPESGKKL